MNTILVTGATGKQGGATARELLAAGAKVHALTRKPDSDAAKALAAKGATIVQGDLDDTASLESALKGVWGVYGVQNTWEAGVEQEEVQGKRLAELAKKAGVQHFVQASVASAQRKTGIPHFDNKWNIEETVRGLGFPSWAIVRPVFFMENLTSPWFLPGILEGKLAFGMPKTTKLQMIAVEDIGKYAAQAFLEHDKWTNLAVDIAGDDLSPEQAAPLLGGALGKTVVAEEVPLEVIRSFSDDYAKMLEWFDKVGYDVDIAKTSAQYGIRATPFAEWVKTALPAAAHAAG